MYLILCINCEVTYIGETECLRERMNNTKSGIRNANASSLTYMQHKNRCRNLQEPLLIVYPFYKSELMFRKFRVVFY